MGNDIAKMAGVAGPPKNKTGSSVVKQKVETASKLGILSLTEHKLEKVPKLVAQRLGGPGSKLRTLDLSANKLEALPEDFSFPKLQTCNVARNRLAGLPAFAAAALKKLDASGNKLAAAALEECLRSCPNLEELRLARNPLGGRGPAALSGLAKLRVLDCSDCGLVEILPEGSFPALVEADFDGNKCEGLDRGLAARAPVLRQLSLERNRLKAAGLPTTLLQLASLTHLDLKGNPLSKRAFLDIPGCDDFMARREKARKKEAGQTMADLSVCGLDD